MATQKEIKSRIKSVKNTGKITKAMELISTVKMKKAQQSVLSARPFAIEAARLLMMVSGDFEAPSVATPSHRELVVLIASNKGLCGSYNINAFKSAFSLVREHPETGFDFIAIGKRARDFILRTGSPLIADLSDLAHDQATERDSRKAFKTIATLFEEGGYDRVRIVYSHYISAIRQQSVAKTILPVSRDDISAFLSNIGVSFESAISESRHTIEPDLATIRDEILPFIASATFHETLLEAKASEHASRMVAMKNAKDSAAKKTSLLTLSYNKARQANITKEISEIVSGVESMKE